jgi:molybdate transport system ATP-binding protein
MRVPAGTLALIGPSGAGKSSVLRMAAGLLRPDAGRIGLGGRTLFVGGRTRGGRVNMPPERRRVGLVFQDHALFPHLTVVENVAFAVRAVRAARRRSDRGAGRGRGAAARHAWGLLERFGIRDLAERSPVSLSGGERQRVAVARTLAAEPEALLLDEPLSALDAVTKAHVATELASILRDAGLPCVLVSHDVADVLGLAERIAVIEAGSIVQVGTASDLLEAPASAFVAGFTGVNYFAGTATRQGELTVVRSAEGDATFASTDPATGPVGVVVPPWDVSLSLIRPEGSALNALAGPVRRVVSMGNRARVTVGSTPSVVAEVTEGSVRRLGLAPGAHVVATWKATGTRLVPRSG